MPFDDKKWRMVANHGDLGGVALATSIAIRAQMDALRKISIATGVDTNEEYQEMESARQKLWDTFVDLTGYERGGE